MKFCPVCQTRYDEEILRFCTKDGASLVDENPTFTEMPSEEVMAEDIDEETLVRRNQPPAQPYPEQSSTTAQRIVISTRDDEDDFYEEEFVEKEPVRAKPLPEPRVERKSNTALVVLTTMFGTFTVLALLGGIWYFLSGRNAANSNTNANKNINVTNTNSINANADTNTNINTSNSLFDFNANTNVNANVNINANVNANQKTPTPTRTPTPTPTPDSNTNVNANTNIDPGNINVSKPTVTPSPTASPTASPSPTPTNVNVGIMNNRAINLTKPAYPPAAKQMNASGEVRVQVSIDEGGNVTFARAISGHALLRSPAENAARQSRFNPVRVGDRAVSATGIVVYNFINQ